MKKDDIGNRMKGYYEQRGRNYLTRRTPVILRLDGKAFHSFTKDFERPFSKTLSDLMTDTALYLVRNIQGAKLCYTQSDEISILITDFDKLTTDAWFNYETSKMNSIAASMCTAQFNRLLTTNILEASSFNTKNIWDWDQVLSKLAMFDCRAFNIPPEEIPNYFRWRYDDWLRNSIQMLSQSHFSHKELHGKNRADMHEMLHKIDVNWADLDPLWKNGTLLYKNDKGWIKDTECQWIKHVGFLDFCKTIIAREE